MPQILVEDLSKTYLVSERQAGAWGAVRGLFRRRYRIVEAEAFGANSEANMEYVMRRGWVAQNAFERFVMRLGQSLEGIIGGLPLTSYAAQS